MRPAFRSWFRTRQSRIQRRLDNTRDTATARPALPDRRTTDDGPRRDRAIAHGGIGASHMPAHRLGFPQAIGERLHLLELYKIN